MRSFLRALIVLLAAGVLMVSSTGVALAAAVVTRGMVTIEVEDRGPDGVSLYIPVPAAFLEVAADGMQMVIPDRELAKVKRAVGPWGEPVSGLIHKLADSPDAVLVSVTSANETVRIEKRGRNLEIEVHDSNSDVRISIPLPSVARVLSSLT
jgi:hypothetical protein